MTSMDFWDFSVIVYIILLIILSSLSLFYFYVENNLLVFSILLISIGSTTLLIIEIIIAKNTTKKLGYGPIKMNIFAAWIRKPNIWLWEEKYYKRENYYKIHKWEKEFIKLRKKYFTYYLLSTFIILTGLIFMASFAIAIEKYLGILVILMGIIFIICVLISLRKSEV